MTQTKEPAAAAQLRSLPAERRAGNASRGPRGVVAGPAGRATVNGFLRRDPAVKG